VFFSVTRLKHNPLWGRYCV